MPRVTPLNSCAANSRALATKELKELRKSFMLYVILRGEKIRSESVFSAPPR
jgi:hypothetical protein